MEQKVSGGQVTGYRMVNGFPHGHMSEWPVGRYHKADYHGPGALLVGLVGEGYVLVWARDCGIHPYRDGHGDKVLKVPWGPRSMYGPPDGWYHQHINTGSGPARHLAVYGPPSSSIAGYVNSIGYDFTGNISMEEGGTLINYEDEDPQIRKDYEEAIGRKGIRCAMPPVTYRAA